MSTLLHTPSSLSNGLERNPTRPAYAAPQPSALQPVTRAISRAARALWQGAIKVGEMRAARAIQQRQYWY